MGQLPLGTEQGYAAPSVRQFSVFLDNRVGKLLELVQLFDDAHDVTMVSISVLDSSDHAVIRLIFDNADAARHLLRSHKFTFSEVELLVFELDDEHTLTHACLFLLGAELNIRFAYPILPRHDHGPLKLLALSVDDNTFAGQILLRKGFRLMAEEELA
ncbi:MAG: hypothetical protein MK082_11450 [Phycisphaerales bacterium]|nr:hypothetical protein [Phycisphaerales bacterium]